MANYSDHAPNSFEVWIGMQRHGEDISFAYGAVSGGDGGFLTVGAENKFGNRGPDRLLRRHGHGRASGTDLVVSSTPATPGETKTITITAKGDNAGTWRNCAEMFAPSVFGEATSCVEGEVTKPKKK